MIERDGINVKYTHDEEALLGWLLAAREFAGIDSATLIRWLAPLRPYSYSASYHYYPEAPGAFFSDFQVARSYLRREDRTALICVDLWKPQETGRRLLEDHGFSCVICGARCAFEARGKLYQWDFERAVHDRQAVSAPALACRDCAIDLPAVFSPFITAKRHKQILARLFARAA